MQIKPWQVGRRVARKDGEELGVVVEVDQLGTIKLNGTVAALAITA